MTADLFAPGFAERAAALIDAARPADVERALRGEELTPADLAALLAPVARPYLEAIAEAARRTTRRQFGRAVGLYAPIYLSNACDSGCRYCGFAAERGASARRTLTVAELHRECATLRERGLRHVLLVSGDAPRDLPPARLEELVRVAREHFEAVSLEVPALEEPAYRRLAAAGVEGVTLYQETYDREVYARVHPRGAKRDFDARLDALARAGRAGVRRLTVGALLGLSPWRVEGLHLGLHARHLERTCWRSAVGVAFPRLRHVPAGFHVPAPVDDAALVQLIVALRLFLPAAGFALSTREPPELRDRLVPLGVTLVSAGSSTRPGGYAVAGDATLSQFDTEDQRPPAAVAAALRRAGFDPVWKDHDRALDDAVGHGGA